jgi:hypothetical protein
VKLYRKTLDSAVWKCSPNVRSVFVTCLLMSNWKPGNWLDRSLSREVVIPRGTFATTLVNLAQRSKVTLRELRTALHILSKLQILTKRSTNHCTYISLLNFAHYNDSANSEATRQLTFEGQTDDTGPARIEEVEEVKKGKKHLLGRGSPSAVDKSGDNYIPPDEQLQPADSLILEFKLAKGLPYDDVGWDRRHKEKNLPLAAELLAICRGDFALAKKCIQEKAKELVREKYHFTMDTILNQAHDWVVAQRGRHGATERKRMEAARQSHKNGGLENVGSGISGILAQINVAEPEKAT